MRISVSNPTFKILGVTEKKGSSLFSVESEEEASGLRGASTSASVSGRPPHAGWETCATTIGRANPKIAGSRPGGVHARRRAWARLTRRQPPHARARALPKTNPAANGRSPFPLLMAKNPENPRNAVIGNGLGRRRRGKFAHAGGRRGAHGVTRPTTLGARQVFSISWPTSEFGFSLTGDVGHRLSKVICMQKVQPWRVSKNPGTSLRLACRASQNLQTGALPHRVGSGC
jgi:hypothetical protein